MRPENLTFFRDFIREAALISLGEDKEYLIVSRLNALYQREGFSNLDDYIDAIRSQPSGPYQTNAVEAMATHETTFFRDVNPFDSLRDIVIPQLIQNRENTRQLKFWSAACSSGQEPYSLAMLIREHFPLHQIWDVKILATDFSLSVLDYARKGLYTQIEVNRGLPAQCLVRFFKKQGSDWLLDDAMIRQMIEFQCMNLNSYFHFINKFDVIFLRNVLIYFDVDSKRMILEKIRDALNPDGYLILGGAETTLNLCEDFEPVPVGKAVFYRLAKT